jgi:hypothetical protein
MQKLLQNALFNGRQRGLDDFLNGRIGTAAEHSLKATLLFRGEMDRHGVIAFRFYHSGYGKTSSRPWKKRFNSNKQRLHTVLVGVQYMTIELTPEQEQAIQKAIKSGVVRSVDEFID